MDSQLQFDNNTADPWFSPVNVITSDNLNHITKFEDNFNSKFFVKLPDSEEYLAILERKLKKIKNNSNVLAQLAEKREACMQELLTNGTFLEEDQHIDFENSAASLILKAIAPQKQALNHGELLELVKNDQLDSTYNSHNSSTEVTQIESKTNKII